MCFQIQPSQLILNTSGLHNAKIIVGYVQTSPELPFQHADNADLAHLAKGDRVCLFMPVRPAAGDRLDQDRYAVNTLHSVQSICVIEFAKTEMIHYEWFRDAKNLDKHILCDLTPHFTGQNTLKPGLSKPLVRFDIDGKGGWTVRVERDGTDGLKGGEKDGDWDVVVTHEAPGARKYTVNVTNDNSAWAMSLFSPGGKPMETSEILVGLKPYDRKTGKSVAWPDRKIRERDIKLQDLPKKLAEADKVDTAPAATKPAK